MIPADLASRLRLVSQDLPAPVQAIAAQQKITDVLQDLTAGQRIMAEIQALLPNGTYRAIVAQREITLALPLAAKVGDSIELEVVESDGKLTLSFVANRTASEAAANAKGNDSVATTLSKTGNLIGNILSQVDQQGGQAKPAALNANQPLVATFPDKASDLAPILKDSLIKSGMFYEAHQARWVEGKLPTANLLQEPQGKLSSLVPAPLQQPPLAASNLLNAPPLAALPAGTSPQSADTPDYVHLSAASLRKMAGSLEQASVPQEASNKVIASPHHNQPPDTNPINRETPNQGTANSDLATLVSRSNPVHPELTPIVQQQLNALATQNYVWQGQVWPGQNMHWEITENDGRPRTGDEEITGNWQTRLKLDLPHLGGIDARIGLDSAGKLSVFLRTDQENSQSALQAAGTSLGEALRTSGLELNKFTVIHGEIAR